MSQIVVNGLLLGANYALLGLGYTLVFGVMRLLTLAHGVVFVAAGVLALLAATAATPLWAVAAGTVLVGAALSAATDLVSFRPVGYDRPIAAAVSTIGFAFAIQNTVVRIRGSETPVVLSPPLSRTDFEIGGLLISTTQLASLVIAAVVLTGTHLFVRRTRWGTAMRAFAHDPEVVGLLGVPVRRLTMGTLAIAGALAGLASFLMALRTGSAFPLLGLDLGLKGLAIMTIGGLGSLTGAVVAGLALGLVEAFAAYRGFIGIPSVVPWLVLIAVLLVRPQGLVREPQG